MRRKFLAQKEAAKKGESSFLTVARLCADWRLPTSAAEEAAASGEAPAAAAATARRIVQMPDEYLPPNKILFVQNLPDDTTKESLEALFAPSVSLRCPPVDTH